MPARFTSSCRSGSDDLVLLTDTRENREPSAIPARLAVTRLTLTNFRSYRATELAVAGGAVALAGPNGAGKTNILDAISLLSPGRGLRGAKLAEHVRKGPAATPVAEMGDALWAVAATISRAGADYEIGTGLTLGPNGGERRHVRLNGVEAKSSADLGDLVQMIWLTPAMDRLFTESAGGRRRFLDRLVLGFEPSHARASTRYETAMRERARLLKYGPRDPNWLDGLENEMAEAGVHASTSSALPRWARRARSRSSRRRRIRSSRWRRSRSAASSSSSRSSRRPVTTAPTRAVSSSTALAAKGRA